ncbi:hypothetical protein ABKU80_17435 [Enterobacter mori]|uniref:hypothetical protein n=1 Tax=Enterobacter mori TaxID=539813 RepID=UPI0032AFAAAA
MGLLALVWISGNKKPRRSEFKVGMFWDGSSFGLGNTRIFHADPSKIVGVLISCLTVLQQSRGYFQQENVNRKDKETGHPQARVVKVFPVVFDLIARKMTRHILGRSL